MILDEHNILGWRTLALNLGLLQRITAPICLLIIEIPFLYPRFRILPNKVFFEGLYWPYETHTFAE
jgi:hypothetical protein